MQTLFIIDANSLIHRAFHALPAFTSPDGKPSGALYGVASIILKIIKERKPEYITAAFDRPEPTFRDNEYKEYKATRAKTADELISQLIEAHNLFDLFGVRTFEIPGFEADDIIATLAHKFSSDDVKVNIFSGDLDSLQSVRGNKIVAEIPQKGISNSIIYDDVAVEKRFHVTPKQFADYKGLVGDTSDNIPGVSGIGPKTASELINKYGSIEAMYQEIEELGMSNEKLRAKLIENKSNALLSKRLATLRFDAPVETDFQSLELKPLDVPKIEKYFNDFGFKTLVSRLK